MGATRLYSLRPPGNQAKPTDPGLERMFRIEMKRDDMAAENIAPGDPILLECSETKAGGVGIAFLSSDVSKTQGPRPIAKIYDPLKKMCGLTMEDKCTISKYKDPLQPATKVIVSDMTPANNPVPPEVASYLEHWVGVSLGTEVYINILEIIELTEIAQLPLITPGYTFDVTAHRGPSVIRKRTFKIEDIQSEDQTVANGRSYPSLVTRIRSAGLLGQNVCFQGSCITDPRK
jgi:hypothetical protein